MEEKTEISDRYKIPMLEKAFELLEMLKQYPMGITMQELIKVLQQPKASVYRMLCSLTQMGYIRKDEDNSRYFLSRKLLQLGLAALGESNIVELSHSHMQRLRNTICESIMLGVLMHNRVVLLDQVLGSHDFTFLLRPGGRFELHSSAPGKVFLAYATDEDREELLQSIEWIKHNQHTITCRRDMLREIEQVRQLGYAVDLEEGMDGVHCVAVPIFNRSGNIIATLWTSGPSGRLRKQDFPAIAEALKQAARNIAQSCG